MTSNTIAEKANLLTAFQSSAWALRRPAQDSKTRAERAARMLEYDDYVAWMTEWIYANLKDKLLHCEFNGFHCVIVDIECYIGAIKETCQRHGLTYTMKPYSYDDREKWSQFIAQQITSFGGIGDPRYLLDRTERMEGGWDTTDYDNPLYEAMEAHHPHDLDWNEGKTLQEVVHDAWMKCAKNGDILCRVTITDADSVTATVPFFYEAVYLMDCGRYNQLLWVLFGTDFFLTIAPLPQSKESEELIGKLGYTSFNNPTHAICCMNKYLWNKTQLNK